MGWKGLRVWLLLCCLAPLSAMAVTSPCGREGVDVAECLEILVGGWETDVIDLASISPGLHAQLKQEMDALLLSLQTLRNQLNDDADIASVDDAITRTIALQEQVLQQYHLRWQKTALGHGLFYGSDLEQWQAMVQLESRQALSAIANTYHRWQARIQDDTQGLSRYRNMIGALLVLVIAIASFIGLHRLTRRSTSGLFHLHNRIVERANKRRWVKALARLISGTAPLAPWILLWIILSGFAALFSGSNAALLLWWVPLAQLYIIYGLLCLLGEWLLLRISQGAGVFLNTDQNKQISLHAKERARWLVWPWVLLYIIDHWIGPSLLYRAVELFAWVVAWFVIGTLLKLRHQDYLANLKRLLPETLDPLAERLLSERSFIFAATALLPLQLLLFLREYLDQLLSDFDWYRSLSARWFRIRTKSLVETEDDEVALDEICEQYERWFASSDNADDTLPAIDTGLMPAIRKPFDAWMNERTDENVLLITGEKGMGKSAALSRLHKQLNKDMPEVHIERISVPPKTTARADVYAMIGDMLGIDMQDGPAALARSDESREPTVIMLDAAQNLFLSEVGHLDGWRALLDLTNTRVENLFWVIAINNQSWAYLCNVFGREYQMRQVVRVKRWSQNEIRSLILSRHHLSGYKLQYEDILLATRGPEAGNLRNAEQRYFSLLWDSCRGVPMAALELWLSSIRTDGSRVLVGLPQAPSSSALEKQGSKLLFVYAAIATHENLTSGEINIVTNQQENVVRYALKAALDSEFIERGDDGRYRITPLWYHTVISYLTRKNMLHE
ncbi:MAG: hypothetical protein CVV10_08295 [Gammaproteobacteria bacterium HGW-Gammaproteobacteria-14]|nr:MAG: hypothetical protein CVV10_08295 [Gammaproteobacteria bacterium HGW-Gammaproteobacteria-14]